jgi:hypothetical protein
MQAKERGLGSSPSESDSEVEDIREMRKDHFIKSYLDQTERYNSEVYTFGPYSWYDGCTSDLTFQASCRLSYGLEL